MLQLLSDSSVYDELAAKGPERAALFSWENMALHVLKIYESLNLT
jgi:glycosyltransferase involved in cell wall biosynthesis